MRQLFPHQIPASAFLAGKEGHLLAADPGCGKTLSAIDAAKAMGARRILTVCPAVAVTGWVKEYAQDMPDLPAVDLKRYPKLKGTSSNIVMSMDWLGRTSAALEFAQSVTWDLVIVDEAHFVANPEAKRTASLYTSGIRTGKYIQLTGTPTPRHAGQLWSHINATAPERIDHMSYDAFTRRYCVIKMKQLGGMRFAQPMIVGNNRVQIPNLRTRLDGWWLRQKKADVLPYLPPKLQRDVPIHASRVDMAKIRDSVDPDLWEYIEFGLETNDLTVLDSLSDSSSRLLRLLAEAKVEASVEHADMLLQSGTKALGFWGVHVDALRNAESLFRKKGYTTGRIDGATSQAQRDAIVSGFQAGKLDVFLGQIAAAGTAITLTAASRAVFLERTFVPASNEQASDRHHRIGQTDTVWVDNMVLEGTIDTGMAAVIDRRTQEWKDLANE